MERPELAAITRVHQEAEGISTVFIDVSLNALPGQFVMLWIPGLDEKPFAISYLGSGEIGITVASVGVFSERLCSLKPGERVGVRGPYGNPYRLEGRSVVMVGGGYGSASLTLLAEEAVRAGIGIRFILGARSKARLVFEERIIKLIGKESLFVMTDDGSAGRKGFVTDALKGILSDEQPDMVYACGPDRMLKAVVELCTAKNVKGQASVERYMKCGYGLCGHCCVDPLGIRLCVEGPVLDFGTASAIKELGKYRRVKSSRKEEP